MIHFSVAIGLKFTNSERERANTQKFTYFVSLRACLKIQLNLTIEIDYTFKLKNCNMKPLTVYKRT
jgi:hypothetical protein